MPLTEGVPRVKLEPNFYYTQEDLLAKYITTHPRASYNVTMPQWILAAVAGTDMTIFYPLAVYASIQRKLKHPLEYPGDLTSWDNNHPISSGPILGTFYEWLVLTEGTAGESFNVTDGSEFTFGKLWPILASWFGLEWHPPQEKASYREVELPFVPRGYVLPQTPLGCTDKSTKDTDQKANFGQLSVSLNGQRSRRLDKRGRS